MVDALITEDIMWRLTYFDSELTINGENVKMLQAPIFLIPGFGGILSNVQTYL